MELMLKVIWQSWAESSNWRENKTILHLYATKLALINKPVTWGQMWKSLSGLIGKGKREEVESSQPPPLFLSKIELKSKPPQS